MKNWLKILKFTLKQALRGPKFITSTAIIGIVILLVAGISNIFISGAFDNDSKTSDLENVYIVNETDLTIDTDIFVQKHQKDYPLLTISNVSGLSAKEAAQNPDVISAYNESTVILELSEDKDGFNLTAYIPNTSTASSSEAEDFAYDFSESVKSAKIKSIGVSEDKLGMAIGDLNVTYAKAEEANEENDYPVSSYMAHMLVMMALYFLVIFYGQSIGQIVSMEKTSKLMEYILTLTGPSGIIFGKVTAIFCEAVIQIVVWIACGLGGVIISNSIIESLIGPGSTDIISHFVEMLPKEGLSHNFVVLMILALIALLAAFLFYCFVSALFASFASTAEELSQTNSMSILAMLAGFLVSMYIPLYTDNSPIGMLIVRIIPFTSAFSLPGDIICARISLIEFIIYISLLIFFTVMLAILTGKVYKNRLFKKGTRKIFAEIGSVITGKVKSPEEVSDPLAKELSDTQKALPIESYENHDRARKTYTIIGFALLTLILGGNVLGGLIGNVLANIVSAKENMNLQDVYSDTTFLVINNIIAMYLVACPLCALVMKLSNDSVLVKKGSITKNQYFRAICIIFPVAYSLSYFSNFLASLLSGGESENTVINTLITGNNVLSMIMVAVLAPIFEELVFRKLIIDRTRRYGEAIAILYSSLAFGIFHCNLYQLFYAFAIGILLGYVYVRTGNVILTIIMHMIMNSSSAILYPLAPAVYEYFEYAMIILGIASVIYTFIKRDVKIEHAQNEVASKELSAIAFLNSGTIIFTLVCTMILIYTLLSPLLLG